MCLLCVKRNWNIDSDSMNMGAKCIHFEWLCPYMISCVCLCVRCESSRTTIQFSSTMWVYYYLFLRSTASSQIEIYANNNN